MLETATVQAKAGGAVQRYFETSLFLLLTTSTLALVSTGKLDLLATLLPVAALAVKAYRLWQGRGPEISPRTATVAVVAFVVLLPYDLWVYSRGLAAGAPNVPLYAGLLSAIHLMLFMMVVRLYSARSTRDYVFLALLSFAMMLGAAILTVDTAYLAFFLAFLVLAVSTFMGLEMQRSAEGAATAPLPSRTPAATRLHKALRWTSVCVALSALGLGTAVFFLIPRYKTGFLGGYTLQPQLISGFDDNVELGQIGEIKKNPAVVMRVRIENQITDLPVLRWRGIALRTFDGRRWFNPPDAPVVQEATAQNWYRLRRLTPTEYRNSTEILFTVLLEPLASNVIFVPYRAVALRGDFTREATPSGRRRLTYLLLDRGESVSNPHNTFSRVLYQGISYVPRPRPELLQAALPEQTDSSGSYLQLPLLDPRVRQLAKQIAADAPTAYDKATALEFYLRTRFGYTLEQPHPSPADPLAHFLFERRAGHCEYFATAMTVMLRALGIPARYVNGFQAGEYNDVADDFIVRASDAHSWVEVYFRDYGWIAFDPTPPSGDVRRGWLGRLTLYWDWFELAWSEWVINYDTGRQATLAQGLLRNWREWSGRARDFFRAQRHSAVESMKEWQERIGRSPYSLPVTIGLALLLLVVAQWRRLRDVLATRWGLSFGRKANAASRLATLSYHELLRLLERRGYVKPPGQTPLEFGASLPSTEWAPPVRELTHLYHAARFGAQPVEREKMTRLLASIRQLLRSKSANTHALRRDGT